MRCVLLALVLAGVQVADAQVDSSVGGALRSLSARAGVVFVGQVTSAEREGGVFEVRFSVQQVVQGQVGATYAVREWAGLWAGGQQRYVVGQRAMWFFHAPNAAGLSSPVDGMEGIVPLVPMGADAVPLLDVRRLATRVQRAVGEPMQAEAVSLTDAVASVVAMEAVEPRRKTLPGGWRPMPIQKPGQMRTTEGAHGAQ
jgi:hypothetical protein